MQIIGRPSQQTYPFIVLRDTHERNPLGQTFALQARVWARDEIDAANQALGVTVVYPFAPASPGAPGILFSKEFISPTLVLRVTPTAEEQLELESAR